MADPKAKKDPKAQAQKKFTDEEEEIYGHKKIYLEHKSDVEPKELNLKLNIIF